MHTLREYGIDSISLERDYVLQLDGSGNLQVSAGEYHFENGATGRIAEYDLAADVLNPIFAGDQTGTQVNHPQISGLGGVRDFEKRN